MPLTTSSRVRPKEDADVDGGGVDEMPSGNGEGYGPSSEGCPLVMRPYSVILRGVQVRPKSNPQWPPYVSWPMTIDDPGAPAELQGKNVYATIDFRASAEIVRDIGIVAENRIEGYTLPPNALKKIKGQGYGVFGDLLANIDAILQPLTGHRVTALFGGAVEGTVNPQYPDNYFFQAQLPGKTGDWVRTFTMWPLLGLSPIVTNGEQTIGQTGAPAYQSAGEEDDDVPF